MKRKFNRESSLLYKLHPESVKSKALTDSGVTLVALVATIIALVILAGVTIKILNDGNTIGQAFSAVTQHQRDQEMERLKLWWTNDFMKHFIEDEDELEDLTEEELVASLKAEGIEATVEKLNIAGELNEGKARIKITSSGNIYEINLRTGAVKFKGENGSDIELAEADLSVWQEPVASTWTNDKVTVYAEVSEENDSEDYTILYMTTGDTALHRYNATTGIEVTENTRVTIIVRSEITGDRKLTATHSVGNIDKLAPNGTLAITQKTASTVVTVNASDSDATSQYGKSGIKGYYYSKDGGNTWTPSLSDEPKTEATHTFRSLFQGTEYDYKVRVVDNAGNYKDIGEKSSTDTINGTIQLSATWDESIANTANVSITGEYEDCELKYIVYNIGSAPSTMTFDNWTTIASGGTVMVSSGKRVTVVLWDGTNASNTANIDVLDDTDPAIYKPETTTEGILASTADSAQSVTLSAHSVDVQSLVTNAGFISSSTEEADEVTPTRDTGTITSSSITANGTYYFGAKDGAGNTSYASIAVNNIDRTAPVVTVSNSTTKSITFKATDNVGVVGYMVTDSSTTPSADSTGWTTIASTTDTGNITVDSRTQGTTYYVYAKDAAGNVAGNNKSTELITGTITQSTSWDETTANTAYVTFGTETNYTIHTSKNLSNWSTTNPVTASSGETVYARLYDGYQGSETNYYATANVIDETDPAIYKPETTTAGILASTADSAQSVTLSAHSVDNQSLVTNAGFISSSTEEADEVTPAKDTGTITSSSITANGTYYFGAKDGAGNTNYASIAVNNIDRTQPVVTISSSTSNSLTFKATDNVGVVGYMVTTSSTAPSADSNGWTAVSSTTDTENITVDSRTQGTTYYVYAKDSAGNVGGNNRGTENVALSTGNITSSVTGWSGATATVQFTTSTGYYIQTKVGDGNWSSNPASTGSATTTADSGTTVYARLTDSTGQTAGDWATEMPLCTKNVIYDTAGGSGGPSNTIAQHTSTYNVDFTSTPIKNGYTFAGWKYNNVTYTSSGTKSFTMPAEDVTLVAQWTEVLTASISTNKNELTTGTTITYSVSAGSGIAEGEIRINGVGFYAFGVGFGVKSDSYTISIEDIKDCLTDLDFMEDYTIEVYVLAKSGVSKSSTCTVTNYTVNKAADLTKLAQKVNAGTYSSSTPIYQIQDINLNGSSSNQWTPIGTSSNTFSGVYDGGYKKITGIYIDTSSEYRGFFGYNSGTIRNLVMASGTFKAGKYSGSLCGKNTGVIERVGNEIDVYSYTGDTGGLIGEQTGSGSRLSEAYNIGDISGNITFNYGAICGLVGWGHETTIQYCYNAGEVSATSSNANTRAAGLSDGNPIAYTACYNRGDILINQNNVSCPVAAGISGQLHSGSMTNCVNVGNTSVYGSGVNNRRKAGLSGYYGATYTNCYWDTSCSDVGVCQSVNNNAYTSDGIIGSFQISSNAILDAIGTNYFIVNDGGYPILKWQSNANIDNNPPEVSNMTISSSNRTPKSVTITCNNVSDDSGEIYYKYTLVGTGSTDIGTSSSWTSNKTYTFDDLIYDVGNVQYTIRISVADKYKNTTYKEFSIFTKANDDLFIDGEEEIADINGRKYKGRSSSAKEVGGIVYLKNNSTGATWGGPCCVSTDKNTVGYNCNWVHGGEDDWSPCGWTNYSFSYRDKQTYYMNGWGCWYRMAFRTWSFWDTGYWGDWDESDANIETIGTWILDMYFGYRTGYVWSSST